MNRRSTITAGAILGIICCLYTLTADASTGEQVNIAFNTSAAVILGGVIILGIRIAAKNLKKVDKHLEESFGEKVLP